MPKTAYIFLATLFLNTVSAFGTVHTPLPKANAIGIHNHQRNSLDQRPFRKFQRGEALNAVKLSSILSLRGGGQAVNGDLVNDAFGWCTNLGAPAALVAGAVIDKLYDKLDDDSLTAKKGDTNMVIFLKRMCGFLLLSAFALQVVSIFVTTITGTMLLTLADRSPSEIAIKTASMSSLGFLRENFEFEYLTSRITFLQGLINWLASIAIEFVIPKENKSVSKQKRDKAAGAILTTTILMIFSFYNGHANFYKNYFDMLCTWGKLLIKKYFFSKPLQVLPLLIVPGVFYSSYLLFDAFTAPPDDE